MWINELSRMYNEAWGPTTPWQPGDVRSNYPAQETQDSLRYKGVFGAADSPPNILSQSTSSGQNPTEQEEDQSILIDFDKWWKLEGGRKNFPSPEIEDASKRLAYEAWMAAKDFYEFGG